MPPTQHDAAHDGQLGVELPQDPRPPRGVQVVAFDGASVCFQRLAAAFIPHICLAEQRKEIPDDINIFPLLHNGRPLIQQVNLIRLRERFLPRPHRYFQDLLSGYLRAVEQVHLERTV